MYIYMYNLNLTYVCISFFSEEKDDTDINVIPHISMAKKSLDMSQDFTEEYDFPPDALRDKTTYIPADDTDDSFESDDEQEKTIGEPYNPKVGHVPEYMSGTCHTSNVQISDSNTPALPYAFLQPRPSFNLSQCFFALPGMDEKKNGIFKSTSLDAHDVRK